MIKSMDKEYLLGRQEIIMLELLLMIIDMVMVKCSGKISIIRVFGKEACNMEMESCVRME